MRSLLWFVVYFIIGLTLVTGVRLGMEIYAYRDRIYPGIFIDEVPVGGLPRLEAQRVLNTIYKQKTGPALILTLDETVVARLSTTQINYRLPLEKALDEARVIGRDPSKHLLRNVVTALQLLLGMNDYRIPLVPEYSRETISEKLKTINEAYRTEPVDARFEFTENRVAVFSKEENGNDVDISRASIDIINALNEPETRRGKRNRIPITLSRRILMPSVKLRDINTLGITELVASGSYHYVG